MMYPRFPAILVTFLALLLLPVSSIQAIPNADLPAGYGLDFDGIDDYAHVDPFHFITGNSPLTLETWVFPRSYPAPNPDCYWTPPGGPTYGLAMILGRGKSWHDLRGDFQLRLESDGKLHFHLYATWWDHFRSVNTIALDSWTHVAVVYDSARIHLYLNGEQDPAFAPAIYSHDDSANIHGIRLGAYENENDAGPHCPFDGVIDEVRIWSIARSVGDIQEYMHTPLTGDEPGLVAYWRLDEGTGQVFEDATTDGHGGELGSTPTPDDNDPTWHFMEPTAAELSSFTAHFGPASLLYGLAGVLAEVILLGGLVAVWLGLGIIGRRIASNYQNRSN